MSSLKRNLAMLRRLRKSGVKDRKKLLKNADKNLVQCICDCAYNCINRNVPVSPAQYKKLARHKNILRRLCKKGETWKKKKQVITQSGGFLLPLLAPVLASLVGSLIA